MKIKVMDGKRAITLVIHDITDAVEIYNTARAALGSASSAVDVLMKIDDGEFEVVE